MHASLVTPCIWQICKYWPMVNDIHSFAALHCRSATGKKAAGRDAEITMSSRLLMKRPCRHRSVRSHQTLLPLQPPHQRGRFHALQCHRHQQLHLPLPTPCSLSKCSLAQSLRFNMWACSILRKSWSLPIQNSNVDGPCFRCNLHSSKKHSTDVQLLQSSEGVCECMILVL